MVKNYTEWANPDLEGQTPACSPSYGFLWLLALGLHKTIPVNSHGLEKGFGASPLTAKVQAMDSYCL